MSLAGQPALPKPGPSPPQLHLLCVDLLSGLLRNSHQVTWPEILWAFRWVIPYNCALFATGACLPLQCMIEPADTYMHMTYRLLGPLLSKNAVPLETYKAVPAASPPAAEVLWQRNPNCTFILAL